MSLTRYVPAGVPELLKLWTDAGATSVNGVYEPCEGSCVPIAATPFASVVWARYEIA